jgi:glycosyltransferase involved in cell wall biosynthesis
MKGKLGLVCGSWPAIKCGIGDFSYRLAVELRRQGYPVVVITDRSASATDVPGVEVLPAISSWGCGNLPQLLEIIRQANVACINLQYPTQLYGRVSAIDLLPLMVRWRLRLPVVTTLHEYTSYHRMGRMRVQFLARASTATIIPDPANLNALATDVPGIRSKLHHVPLGPTIEPSLPAGYDRTTWRTTHGVAPRTLVLAYFGFISPGKGVETLLDAVEQLAEAHDVHLWILADRDPSNPLYAPYHALIAERIERVSRSRHITWTGYLGVGQLSSYLAAADLAVLPFADGVSWRRTTLLAALAHGLPVLSTGPRALAPGISVVHAGDAPALAAAIAQLNEHREALTALARDAAQTAASINWASIAGQTAAVLTGVCR